MRRTGEQVWKGEPGNVWGGAMTRFIQAIAWPWADITRGNLRCEHCAHVASELRLASSLFTAHSTEQDSAHAVKEAGRRTTRWLNSAFLLSCFYYLVDTRAGGPVCTIMGLHMYISVHVCACVHVHMCVHVCVCTCICTCFGGGCYLRS